jgi:hypothetical protein
LTTCRRLAKPASGRNLQTVLDVLVGVEQAMVEQFDLQRFQARREIVNTIQPIAASQ